MLVNCRAILTLPFMSGYTSKQGMKKASATLFFMAIVEIYEKMLASLNQSAGLSLVGRSFSIEIFAMEAR